MLKWWMLNISRPRIYSASTRIYFTDTICIWRIYIFSLNLLKTDLPHKKLIPCYFYLGWQKNKSPGLYGDLNGLYLRLEMGMNCWFGSSFSHPSPASSEWTPDRGSTWRRCSREAGALNICSGKVNCQTAFHVHLYLRYSTVLIKIF